MQKCYDWIGHQFQDVNDRDSPRSLKGHPSDDDVDPPPNKFYISGLAFIAGPYCVYPMGFKGEDPEIVHIDKEPIGPDIKRAVIGKMYGNIDNPRAHGTPEPLDEMAKKGEAALKRPLVAGRPF